MKRFILLLVAASAMASSTNQAEMVAWSNNWKAYRFTRSLTTCYVVESNTVPTSVSISCL